MGLSIQVSILNGMHSKASPRWKRSFRWGPWVLGSPRVHACTSLAGPVPAHPLRGFPTGGKGAPILRKKNTDDDRAGVESAWLHGDEASGDDWGSGRRSPTNHPDALAGASTSGCCRRQRQGEWSLHGGVRVVVWVMNGRMRAWDLVCMGMAEHERDEWAWWVRGRHRHNGNMVPMCLSMTWMRRVES